VGDIPADVKAAFDEGVHRMAAHDANGSWDARACTEAAAPFEHVLASSTPLAAASYDLGLVRQRCGDTHGARAAFQQATDLDSAFHLARAELALYDLDAGGSLDAAIGELQRAVLDARFRNAPALVNLAMLEMRRNASTSTWDRCTVAGDGGTTEQLPDLECARLNLQRALAVDDSYMPAFNQFALYYFARARRHPGGPLMEELDRAALVCSQAEARDASYAPIHNTAGIILFAMGNPSGAARELETAVTLDPRLFEAHVNLGNVNLSFRGWPRAEQAFRAALALRPDDYGAHLGLALSLRGELPPTTPPAAALAAVHAELAACERISPSRPDAYFNEAILVTEYEAPADAQGESLRRARALLETFLAKAGNDPAYADARRTATERLEDIGRAETFIHGGGQPPR
jgi:tetratricopeptide (TPR) repeat protein